MLSSKRVFAINSSESKLDGAFNDLMKQPLLSFPSCNFLRQAQLPIVQRLSFPEENRSDRGAFCPTEINRWIARWENEGGAVAFGTSVEVTS